MNNYRDYTTTAIYVGDAPIVHDYRSSTGISNYTVHTDVAPISLSEYIRKQDKAAASSIKRVIFNPPATIVVWTDGTKTVVKCENEAYDPEKGMAMCLAKRFLGNKGNYYDAFKKWLPEKPVKKEKKEEKTEFHPCITCKYFTIPSSRKPCRDCISSNYKATEDHWERK